MVTHAASQMLRRYWLLSALLDRQWGSQRRSDGRADPQDWHAAQGHLAVATPELAPSSGSAIEAARIEGELAPQLRRLGPRGQLQHLQGAQPGLVSLSPASRPSCWTRPVYGCTHRMPYDTNHSAESYSRMVLCCTTWNAGVVEGLGGVLHDKSASLAAHLAAAAALHLARVQHAPLALLQQMNSLPFASLLRHMQVR